MSYTPQPGSLAARVCAFFQRNPEDELSARDIAQKFDAQGSSVPALLASCLANQLLIRDKEEAGTMVYRAGAKLSSFQSAPPPAAPLRRRRALRSRTGCRNRARPRPKAERHRRHYPTRAAYSSSRAYPYRQRSLRAINATQPSSPA